MHYYHYVENKDYKLTLSSYVTVYCGGNAFRVMNIVTLR